MGFRSISAKLNTVFQRCHPGIGFCSECQSGFGLHEPLRWFWFTGQFEIGAKVNFHHGHGAMIKTWRQGNARSPVVIRVHQETGSDHDCAQL